VHTAPSSTHRVANIVDRNNQRIRGIVEEEGRVVPKTFFERIIWPRFIKRIAVSVSTEGKTKHYEVLVSIAQTGDNNLLLC